MSSNDHRSTTQPSVAFANDRLWTAIHFDELHGLIEALHLGAELEARHRNGETPLMQCGAWDSSACFDYLIARGANKEALNEDGDTVMLSLVNKDRLNLIERLLEAEVSVDARNPFSGETALARAVALGFKSIAETLLARGADPTLRLYDGSPFQVNPFLDDWFETQRAQFNRQRLNQVAEGAAAREDEDEACPGLAL